MPVLATPFLQPHESPLPAAFCWSKYGVESGERVDTILARKERERQTTGGVFLWGIGTSIRPSLEALLATSPRPEVLFSPMRSPAAARDVRPSSVVAWRSACGMDGSPFEIPVGCLVTSRAPEDLRNARHFALVCERKQPLPVGLADGAEDAWVDDSAVRNFLTGRPVGASQVTSVVRAVRSNRIPRYRLAFDAWLTEPYLLMLGDPEPV